MNSFRSRQILVYFLRCFIFIIISGAPTILFAQYEDSRDVQDKEEIASFRKLKVEAEYKYADDGKKKNPPFERREFDTLGRVIVKITPQRKQFISYDAKGNIIDIIDSVLNARGTEFVRFDFEYEYGANGKLSFARIPPYNLDFKYDPHERKLSEITQLDNYIYRKRYFYYDKLDRLIKEEWFYSYGKVEKTRTIDYTRRGKPAKEFIYKCFENYSSDSDRVSYSYDGNNRLTEQKIISAGYYPPGSEEGNGMLKDIDTTIYSYTYNTSGTRNSEQFYYSVKGYNHKYEWSLNEQGLKSGEIYYGNKDEVISKSIYKYTFFNDKSRKKKKK